MAEITMSLIEYQELQSRAADAQKRCVELEARMTEVEMTDANGRIPGLIDCIMAALPIIKFAVGNLAPETIRGWPYDELQTFADQIDKMPGADTRMKEYALEFRNFIREARDVERSRPRLNDLTAGTSPVEASPVETSAEDAAAEPA